MIEIGKISYGYGPGKPVLKDVSLKAANGRIYGIFGLEGSGKSTLLSLMAGARDLQEGVVRINGFDLRQESVSAKRCLGYCPQDVSFYPDMTVYELLEFLSDVKSVQDDRKYIQVHQWMEFFDLEKLRNQKISGLTPFRMLRLKLAQAVVGGSEILLLDEPSTDLTDVNIQSMKKMIRALNKRGKTVFLATSRAEDVLDLADEIALLHDGVLSAFAPANEWLEGCSLMLRTKGDRSTVLRLLSEMEGLISCQALGRGEGDAFHFRIRAASEDRADAVLSLMRANGMEAAVAVEDADEALAALRRDCLDLKNGTGEGEEQ